MWESLAVANGKCSAGRNRPLVKNPSCVRTLFNGFAAFVIVLSDIDKYYLYLYGFRKCKNSEQCGCQLGTLYLLFFWVTSHSLIGNCRWYLWCCQFHVDQLLGLKCWFWKEREVPRKANLGGKESSVL